jgi:ribose/xylose/arabinose/galactoside ABC-type transport system permease subunit
VRWLIEAEPGSVLIALIVVLAVFGIAHPAFFDWHSPRDVLQSAVPYGLLAMGASLLRGKRSPVRVGDRPSWR